ncbi:MOSC domain-containing protein [Bordetella genomosp. 9]|uniref:MOSC domain-containing protein n=1 Tax=Bordetella genomosp. 9 TaxID=1416803 RepID=A0A261RLG4_9BORD|nr:MOSC domain-containing protein [Bordetella genomosp. 9]OZI25805.1 MOSC domain-containing protein [Bordetella genomosp. 9]
MTAHVTAVSASPAHAFSKQVLPSIALVAGYGVQDDAHYGITVQHRSRVARDPTQPNLRQVHLIHSELFTELAGKGFEIEPGQLGENITTVGIDLLALPVDTVLHIGEQVRLRVTGLRNPCIQLDTYRQGLTAAVLDRAPDGSLVRKAGVMSVVLTGGTVRAGEAIRVVLPAEPHQPLERV